MALVKTIELLAPAKNLICGRAAIAHGADAVYIGGPKFGAREDAGNSLEDIEKLASDARLFGVKEMSPSVFGEKMRSIVPDLLHHQA